MACTVCFNLAAEETEWKTFKTNQMAMKFVSMSDLRSSVQGTQCAECLLLWEALSLFSFDLETCDDFMELRAAPGRPMQLALRSKSLAIEAFCRNGDDGPSHPSIGPAKEVHPHSSHQECTSLVKTWFRECRENHRLCKTRETVPLPTRVIDVRSTDPRLVVTYGEHGHYAALTYCWGSVAKHGPPFKTTKENYDANCRGIQMEGLPATLRDAITLCREVGIQYLWIDAICIIQHDEDDWMTESGKMCDVYSNAILTISADQADGNSGGLFNKQEFGSPPTQLSLRGRPVYIRPNLSKIHNDISILTRQEVDTEPIHNRAWTLQEALLSNRMIHYTSKEIVWECNTVRDCECRRGAAIELDEESTRVFRTPELFGRMDLAQAYLQWRQIIQLFTERDMAFEMERLSAMSGMARQFSAMMAAVFNRQERYIAGLWEGDFAAQLLWTADDDYWNLGLMDPRRPREWRAPSWTWAALEAPSRYFLMSGFECLLDFISIEAEPLNEYADAFGKVKSGRLVARGTICHNLTARSYIPTGEVMGVVSGVKYVLQPEDKKDLEPDKLSGVSTFIPDLPSETEHGTRELSALLVGRTADTTANAPYAPFIVLKKIENEHNVFQRVGISFRGIGWEDAGWDLFQKSDREEVVII